MDRCPPRAVRPQEQLALLPRAVIQPFLGTRQGFPRAAPRKDGTATFFFFSERQLTQACEPAAAEMLRFPAGRAEPGMGRVKGN